MYGVTIPLILLLSAAPAAEERGGENPLSEGSIRPGQLPEAMHLPMREKPRIKVGLADADIVGSDNRALQAAVEYVARLGGGTVEIGEGVFLMCDSLHLRSNVRVSGQGEKTVLRKAPSVVSPLACDGDFGQEQFTVKNPEGFAVGYGVAVWDDRAGGFVCGFPAAGGASASRAPPVRTFDKLPGGPYSHRRSPAARRQADTRPVSTNALDAGRATRPERKETSHEPPTTSHDRSRRSRLPIGHAGLYPEREHGRVERGHLGPVLFRDVPALAPAPLTLPAAPVAGGDVLLPQHLPPHGRPSLPAIPEAPGNRYCHSGNRKQDPHATQPGTDRYPICSEGGRRW